MKFTFEKVTDKKMWNSFVESSPQGTIFSNTDYLESSQANYQLYFVYRGEDIRAGVALCLSNDGKDIILDDFVIYNGIMFHFDPEQKETSAKLERQTITEYIIEKLTKLYKNIEISLAPQFEDLRPFLWHNYGSRKQDETFKLNLRYTSYLNIAEFRSNKNIFKMQLFKEMGRLRRRRIKEAIKNEAIVTEKGNLDYLINFYEHTLEKENVKISTKKINRIKLLHSKLNELDLGKTFFVIEKDNFVSYVISVCYDNKRSYALFASGNPESDLRYPGTFAYWNAAKYLSISKQIDILDLEGLNSPRRSWFKIGLGGSINNYFEVSLGVKKAFDPINDQLDHHYLNEIEGLF